MQYHYLGIVLINVLSLFMILVRPALFKTKLYRPMLKNVFLSILPVGVLVFVFLLSLNVGRAGYLYGQRGLVALGFVAGLVGLFVWLLLLPNAGYLITELNLNHRSVDKVEVPLWYDIISVLTLSMSGVVNTLVNVTLVQMIYVGMFYPHVFTEIRFSTHPLLWLITGIVFVLVSFGIYIGRYIRFNSWDVLHPRQMWKKFRAYAVQPGNGKSMLLFVLLYTAFFFVMYLIVVVPLFESGLVWM